VLHLIDVAGREGKGEVAPLPRFSRETLDQCIAQLNDKRQAILDMEWQLENLQQQLTIIKLYPAASFGLESALLSILDPVSNGDIEIAALLMGPPEEILERAALKYTEGFSLVKLKVGHLSFDAAKHIIDQLQGRFALRIDVNRAWDVAEAMHFFDQYEPGAFDYVEEPFKNPQELERFTHPLAVDESYPADLSLSDLERLPTLKAVVYKPTIQGGLLGLMPLKAWADQRGIQLVLSSSFESEIGLSHIAAMAKRLSLNAPLGIDTLPYMQTV
jgi:O-succinylbenzoate synthase